MAEGVADVPTAGVDEAGRGPLAGPVVAAAVILGQRPIDGVGDSKAKTARQREVLFARIVSEARAFGLGMADVDEIDRLNIHHATLLAMQRAVAALSVRPARALIDGRFCPELDCAATAIVGGDASEPAIGAASILAKVQRDRIMMDLHRRFPAYGFDRHKGYPTRAHLAALRAAGVSPVHRRSFGPVRILLAEGTAP
jgi:ribonuclease HII